MPTMRTLRRVAVALVVLPVVLAGLLLLGAGPASAHAVLDRSAPGQGTQVTAAPQVVTLTFSEEVAVQPRAVQVLDPRGGRVDRGDVVHSGGDRRSLQVGLPGELGTGSYTVLWRVVSADGHPVSGSFAFGVGVPAGAVPPVLQVNPGIAALRAVSQLAAYAGAALLIGATCFVFVLWPAGAGTAAMRRVLVAACAIAGAGAVATLMVQGPYVSGGTLRDLLDVGLLGETAASSYGRPLILRVLAVALSVPVLGVWPRPEEGPDGEDASPGGIAAAGNLVLLVASFALTGHAAEASPRLLAELVDGVHLAAAGVWLGGLVMLFAVFLPHARTAERAAVLPRWSQVATACVAALVLTGTYQAWREVRSPAALPGTPYGRLLLGKLALVAVLLAVGAVARSRVRAAGRVRVPAGGGGGADAPPGPGLVRLVTAEAVLGLAVLGVTTFLVATPPSRITYGPPYQTALTAQDLEGRALRVAATVTPTRAGRQTIELQVQSVAGGTVPFLSLTGQLRAENGDDGLDLLFEAGSDGRWSVDVLVPTPGRWTLTVHVLTDPTTDYAATTVYTVR